MDSIGETLQRERQRRGLSVEQVSAETKIAPRFLLAIEEDRFDHLPAGLLTRSFLRQYTHTLGLDEQQAIAAFKEKFQEPELPLPQPPHNSSQPCLGQLSMFVWLVAVVFGCGVLYNFWENEPLRLPKSRIVTPRVAPRRIIIGSNANEKLRNVAEQAAPESSSPSIPAVVSETVSRPIPAPHTMHVVFTASEPVWISVYSAGILAYSGTINSEQSREFDSSGQMTVLVGNVGGLTISVNGQRVGLTGAHGQIQSLALTPDGVHVMPRTTPVSATAQDNRISSDQ